MEILYILLPLALLLGLSGLAGLIWSIRHGQFDDLEGPAYRILFDDDQALLPVPLPTNSPEAPSTTDPPSLPPA
ncbi:cbb3-type cytochrome oxidase assembly protein CcoS [Candidatus Magnetaquicoccus inordinatus]|uniref:cbb3-type cytochrome oxidase assembly protein CcoS n=1 Tax=Candidatus Magnetaquicoccus inordinatus TaxID=2496818 RepID=UPI00102AE366|nr:cbb3-type cytochrome oxidase assembly protein CcoS [Candidatus Magnetaquicoccus inordinatus]